MIQSKQDYIDYLEADRVVYIAPVAKIFGKIEIADDCVIGPNAAVNKSFTVKGFKILGVPVKPY